MSVSCLLLLNERTYRSEDEREADNGEGRVHFAEYNAVVVVGVEVNAVDYLLDDRSLIDVFHRLSGLGSNLKARVEDFRYRQICKIMQHDVPGK